MKYRKGFVSNSSSTSFMVAFVPEESNLNLKTLDFLLTTDSYGPINLKVFRATVKSRCEDLNKELTTITRDKEWLNKHITMLVECMGIEGVQMLMSELEKHKNEVTDSEVIRWKRRDKRPWNDVILDHIGSYKNNIKDIDNKIESINKQLKLIAHLPPETVIAKWEEDAHGKTMLNDLVSMLETDGRVVILEKINT